MFVVRHIPCAGAGVEVSYKNVKYDITQVYNIRYLTSYHMYLHAYTYITYVIYTCIRPQSINVIVARGRAAVRQVHTCTVRGKKKKRKKRNEKTRPAFVQVVYYTCKYAVRARNRRTTAYIIPTTLSRHRAQPHCLGRSVRARGAGPCTVKCWIGRPASAEQQYFGDRPI